MSDLVPKNDKNQTPNIDDFYSEKITELPINIVKHEADLHVIKNNLQNIKKTSDGLIFGMVGIDWFIGLIPVVGGLYSVGVGGYLFVQSFRIRGVSIGEKFLLFCLLIVDIVLGAIPIDVGNVVDGVFRAHAWACNRLIESIDTKLQIIGITRSRLHEIPFENRPLLIERLEDQLFRGGKTRKAQMVMFGVIAVVITGLYFNSQHQARLAEIARLERERIELEKARQEEEDERKATRACIEAGGSQWWCQITN